MPTANTALASGCVRVSERACAKWAVLAGMVAACLVAYAPALRGAFIGDDLAYITGSPLTRTTAGLWRAWSAGGEWDYYPVTFNAWWVMWHLWGDRPAGYHVVNVVLHSVSAWLLWRTMCAAGMRGGLAAGVLWLLHPLNVQSVAWAAEFKNTLSVALLLGALRAYVAAAAAGRSGEGDRGRRVVWYWVSVGLFVLALLSKTSVVAAPCVLVVYEWWRAEGRLGRKAVRRVGAWFVAALVLGAVTMWFQKYRSSAGLTVRPESVAGRVAQAGVAVWFYVAKVVWPARLSYVYPKWSVGPMCAVAWGAIGGVLGALGWFRGQRAGRAAALGVAWFGLMLAPVLGVVEITFNLYTYVADQWAYAPSIGLIALAAAAVPAGVGGRVAKPAVVALLAVFLGVVTFARAEVWRDGETLWRDAVAKDPGAWGAWNSLARAVLDRGDVVEAEADVRRSLGINPANGDAYLNLGAVLEAKGDFAGAAGAYREGAAAVPGNADLKYNLGLALARRGDLVGAERAYRAAIAVAPRHPSAYANLGRVLEDEGRIDEAEQAYRDDIAINPGSVAGRTNLANLLLKRQRLDEAAAVLAGMDDVPNAVNTLGVIRARQGRAEEAERLFRRAIELKGDSAEARCNLAGLLAARGDVTGARREYERALALRPGLEQAVRGLENLPR